MCQDLPLAHFFGAAVMEADIRHSIDDLFAVQLQNHPQHAVRARMLRTDIKEHEILSVAAGLHAPIFGPEAQSLPARHPAFRRAVGRGPFRLLARDGPCAADVRPTFCGMRIRSRCGCPSKRIPNISQTSRSYQFAAGQRSVTVSIGALIFLERQFDADVFIAIKGQEVIHDREIARRRHPRGCILMRSSMAVRS